MDKSLIIALLGVLSAIAGPTISGYLAILKDKKAALAGTTPPPITAKRYRRQIALIVAGIVVAIVIVALYQSSNGILDTLSYSDLAKKGLDQHKPYILPSVVMLVTLEKSPDGTHIDADKQIFYQLEALENIHSGTTARSQATANHEDDYVFQETYQSSFEVHRIPGADPETMTHDSPAEKDWTVKFDVPKGQRHLVITGSHVVTPLQLAERHPPLLFDVLRETDDDYTYTNKGDIIETLLIVVQSRTLKLSLPSNPEGENSNADATRQDINGLRNRTQVEAERVQIKNPSDTHTSVVARFDNLKKNEEVGLRVRWNP